ncbi:hypothetical protein GG804_18705 [Sphingomonas histidinilytica]|uniref:hypothetical protein n=1 Tax=Rhizorhabdus histidinilytica TaxID=439228 RepID=UPI001ADD32F1|nr:hypothetical protein [Rhizorhabdus histidinilytica]MBO9378801.1 hypothetical protein [Rhizorhabdus histidinilytica]
MGSGGLVATDVIARRELAAVFFANGEGFLPSDAGDNRIDGREVCYGSVIAAELVLKAYLLAKGWSDDRCRRDIRHDLDQALASARAAGLEATSPDLDGVIGVLNIYYPKHAFDRFVSPAGCEAFPTKARAIIASLFDLVRPHIEASGGR